MNWLAEGVRGLSPAYFALVMATGIVSIASDRAGFHTIAAVLVWLNAGQYLLLWILTSWRLLRYRRALVDDLTDHQSGPGFLSAVAATGVMGNQLILTGAYDLALALWIFGLFLWFTLTYTIFTTPDDQGDQADDRSGDYRGVVACSCLDAIDCALERALARHFEQPVRLHINFVALSMWLWGGMMYIWMISLIFYRYTFFKFSPADFSSSYWINMGAMAISTLAGSLLIENTADAAFLETLLPFLKGFTIFFWATGTWWIPMLVILGRLAASLSEIPAQVRASKLGRGVSARYVLRLHLRDGARHESGLSAPHRSRVRLLGPAGLGDDLRWAHSQPCQ